MIKNNKIKTIFVTDFNTIDSQTDWIRKSRANKHDFKIYPAKIIQFDFSRSRFLKPYHIAPLACVIHEYIERGFKIQLINIPNALKEYFENFNFNQFCNKSDSNNSPNPLDFKTLPLWRIDRTGINLYPKLAQEYFERNHFKGKDLFILSNSLAELMNNAFDHSLSKIPGYTFTQLTSRNNQIITCLCDFGKGIQKNVNDYLRKNDEPFLESDLALKKAL
ncbi:MAG: hypothetical protein HXX14_00770 [Bacteroidetes bacterium]|nr:hypothetical protein [Bacteroidota bacterium]